MSWGIPAGNSGDCSPSTSCSVNIRLSSDSTCDETVFWLIKSSQAPLCTECGFNRCLEWCHGPQGKAEYFQPSQQSLFLGKSGLSPDVPLCVLLKPLQLFFQNSLGMHINSYVEIHLRDAWHRNNFFPWKK